MRRGIFSAMRYLAASLLLTVMACSGDAPRPAAPTSPPSNAGGATVTTGEVRLRLAGDYPGYRFPLTVTYPGGSAVIADGTEHVITVPASDRELTLIAIEGWRPIWVRVPVGGRTTLSTHPCCGMTFSSNTYDDEIATCADAAGVCPADTDRVPHSLVEDAVCGERERCVPNSRLRITQTVAGGAETITDEFEDVHRVDAGMNVVQANIADMFEFSVGNSGWRHDIAMDRGMSYTVVLEGDRVVRVSVTK